MNTLRATRWMRRAIVPVALLCAVALLWNYGTISVPAGMDTMSRDYPPGTVCLVLKRPSRVAPNSVVFVDVAGGTLLTRVAGVTDEGLLVEHDNPQSRFPDRDELGLLPYTAVRGLVLTAFVAEQPRAPSGR